MKWVILLSVLILAINSNAYGDVIPLPRNLAACKKISWLTSNAENPGAVFFIEINDPETVGKLVAIFKDAVPTDGINPLMMDGDSKDRGWLIFHLNNQQWAVRVYPFVNKPNTVNQSEIDIGVDWIVITEASISTGFEVNKDYRKILRNIPQPKKVDIKKLYKIRFTGETGGPILD
jgi:hypothetical protein